MIIQFYSTALLSINLQSFSLLTLITLSKIKGLFGHCWVTYKIDFYRSFDDSIWHINDYYGYNANLKLSAIFSKNSIPQKRSGLTNNVFQYMITVFYEHSGGYIPKQKYITMACRLSAWYPCPYLCTPIVYKKKIECKKEFSKIWILICYSDKQLLIGVIIVVPFMGCLATRLIIIKTTELNGFTQDMWQ